MTSLLTLLLAAAPLAAQVAVQDPEKPASRTASAPQEALLTLQTAVETLSNESQLTPEKLKALQEVDRELARLVDPDGTKELLSRVDKNLAALIDESSAAPAPKRQAEIEKGLKSLNDKLQALADPEALKKILAVQAESRAKGALGSVRAALAVFSGDSEGRYPVDLRQLTENGKFLKALPEIEVAGHARGAKVRLLTRVRDQFDLEGQLEDSGGWLYVADRDSPLYGTVVIDCTHEDSRGVPWYRY
ncbi:MAG TPA: hypothetical protein DCM05_14625 [Elusimicrobia bacterium]|nr:hypothetical protein [Elusimicrobiota bacterium]